MDNRRDTCSIRGVNCGHLCSSRSIREVSRISSGIMNMAQQYDPAKIVGVNLRNRAWEKHAEIIGRLGIAAHTYFIEVNWGDRHLGGDKFDYSDRNLMRWWRHYIDRRWPCAIMGYGQCVALHFMRYLFVDAAFCPRQSACPHFVEHS